MRANLIPLSIFLMSVFLAPADADAACREGKFILKPQADGSVLVVDECQPTAKAPRRTPAPGQEAKTPPQPATAEPQSEAKAPVKPDNPDVAKFIEAPGAASDPAVIAQKIIRDNFDEKDCPLVVRAQRFGDGTIGHSATTEKPTECSEGSSPCDARP